jgi:hypothetical protein
MYKILLTCIFSFTVVLCSAQNKLLTYQDLQYIIQNSPNTIGTFLQQKDYHLHPASNINETRYLGIFADNDYTDLSIKLNGKHKLVNLLTTNSEQVGLIQKSLATYDFKTNKGIKIYRVKDAAINKVAFSEIEPQKNANKVYTIEFEN